MKVLAFFATMALPLLADAQRTWHVPGQFGTIQAAVGAAAAGDTILVQPGTYTESITAFKAVQIVAALGPWVTTLRGPSRAGRSTVVLAGSARQPAVLRGFTVRGGERGGVATYGGTIIEDNWIVGNTSGFSGGGVQIDGPDVTLRRNTIAANVSSGCGGGVWWDEDPVVIRDNRIVDNRSGCDGGGIHGPDGTVEYNTFLRNVATARGGAIACSGIGLRCVGNLIAGNAAGFAGGGVSFDENASCLGEHCTIVANASGRYGGGVAVSRGSVARFENSIVWGNTAASSGQEAWLSGTGIMHVSFSALRTGSPWIAVDSSSTVNIGASVVATAPRFVDPANFDFHLLASSQLVDAGGPVRWSIRDYEGNPRVVGQHPDLGADELAVNAYVHGLAFRGATIRLRATGAASTPVLLGIARNARLHTPGVTLPGTGPLRLDGPITVVAFGSIPASGLLDVPVRIPLGAPIVDLACQALVGTTLFDPVVISIR